MATSGPDQPTKGKWTFVNSKGEEEDVDDGLSTTSSSSSSEFVKLDGQEASFHHRSKDNNASDTDVFSLSDDDKPSIRCPIVAPPLRNDGCGDTGGMVKSREDSPGSDTSDASLLEDSAALASPTTDTTATTSSEEDSDLEILPSTKPVQGISVPEGLIREGTVRVDQVVGTSAPVWGDQSSEVASSNSCGQSSFLSRQTSTDSSVQFRLVLMPRSISVSDSDSDFSHLDSHSTSDHSDGEDLSDHGSNVRESSVDPGFCFVNQRDPACPSNGSNRELENDHQGGNHIDHAAEEGRNDVEGPREHDIQLNFVAEADDIIVGQQIPALEHDGGPLENADGNGNDANVDVGDDNVDVGDANVDVGDANVDVGGANVDVGDDNVDVGDAIVNVGDDNVDVGDANVDVGDANVDGGDANVDAGDANADVGDANADAGNANEDVNDGLAVDHDGDNGDSDHDDADDADTGTESGVEDDRIESDQSDGPPADEEEDLSFSNIGLENISLHEMNLTRQYVHQPNKYLSGTLSLIVIMAGWMALGLGIGHSLGSSRQNLLHQPSLADVKQMQESKDNLLLCIRQKWDLRSTLQLEALSFEESDHSPAHRTYPNFFRKQMEIWRVQMLEKNHSPQTTRPEFSMMLSLQWSTREKDLTESLTSREETIGSLSREIQNLKIKVNELQQSKTDLMTEIGRLRYQEHPGNSREQLNSSVELKEVPTPDDVGIRRPLPRVGKGLQEIGTDDAEVEMLEEAKIEPTLENENISKMLSPPTELPMSHPTGSEEWENQTEKLKQELSLAQGRAAMWQQLYLSERHRKQPVLNTTPDVLSCLKLFTPKVNFSEILQALNNSIVTSLKDFPNISQIKSYLDDSLESKKIFSTVSEFQAMFQELSNIWLKWSFKETDDSNQENWEYEQGKTKREKYSKGNKRQSEEQTNSWSKSLKQLLNETQESVSRVSREIQEKMKQVRNMSEDLWRKHQPAINEWQDNLSQQISDISSKIKEKLHIKSSRWFGRKKTKHHKWGKHDSRSAEKKRESKERKKQEHKRHGKSEEGGNKGSMKQKAFKNDLNKLVKRIKRLNSKSFNRLGHDGVRGIIKNIQQFQDAYRGRFPDPIAEEWASCQLEWWKSQLDRKKIDSNKCVTNLFRWQSRLEKKERRQTQKRNHKNNPKPHRIKERSGKMKRETENCRRKEHKCRHNKDRRQRNTRKGVHKKNSSWDREEKHKPRGVKYSNFHNKGAFAGTKRRKHHQEQGPRINKYKGKEDERKVWKGTSEHNFTNDESTTVSGKWYFKSKTDNRNEHGESWYIQKMKANRNRGRESWGFSGDWVFERADDRDFHRRRPDDWYYRRAEGRRKGDNHGKRKYPSYNGYDLKDERDKLNSNNEYSFCFWV